MSRATSCSCRERGRCDVCHVPTLQEVSGGRQGRSREDALHTPGDGLMGGHGTGPAAAIPRRLSGAASGRTGWRLGRAGLHESAHKADAGTHTHPLLHTTARWLAAPTGAESLQGPVCGTGACGMWRCCRGVPSWQTHASAAASHPCDPVGACLAKKRRNALSVCKRLGRVARLLLRVCAFNKVISPMTSAPDPLSHPAPASPLIMKDSRLLNVLTHQQLQVALNRARQGLGCRRTGRALRAPSGHAVAGPGACSLMYLYLFGLPRAWRG